MGLDINSVRYHCWLKKKGVRFDRTATLGRQGFHGLSPEMLSFAVKKSGLNMSLEQAREIMTFSEGYADHFYRWLGANVIDSFDYSDYEKATYLWDMNRKVDDTFRGKYDFVFDGGTLEHVYYASQALRESMSLVKTGGVFLAATPANSYLGHGFYQFGPDLPFAVMHERNGYCCGGVHLVEMRNNARFYEVLLPAQRCKRALASTFWPTMMLYWGRRMGEIPEQLQAFQADYVASWKGESKNPSRHGLVEKAIRLLFAFLPLDIRHDLFRSCKLIYTMIKGNAFYDKASFRLDKRI